MVDDKTHPRKAPAAEDTTRTTREDDAKHRAEAEKSEDEAYSYTDWALI